ncbi:hypothetical protein HYFRA_00005517 [Hymenoscyphus fraxineus]|uniref:Uncharacterized protein n=1 Tax=Hymenoscyphus fraxineus TaxID=746836 RepID=A0A9N9KUF4_9HELO|nr:hypothetical protein HYFRA_00005517 [Hymenoscyphus fraxineus]
MLGSCDLPSPDVVFTMASSTFILSRDILHGKTSKAEVPRTSSRPSFNNDQKIAAARKLNDSTGLSEFLQQCSTQSSNRFGSSLRKLPLGTPDMSDDSTSLFHDVYS